MLPQTAPPRARRAPGTNEPKGLVPALVLLGFGITALCGVAALLLVGRLPAPAPPTPLPALVPSSVPPVTAEPAAIEGLVWEDVCDEHQPSTPACVLDSGGRYGANGQRDPNEQGLAGLMVVLGVGPCPAAPVLTPLTGPDGRYRFAGLPPGTYCVSIDPARDENAHLIPGGWTSPLPGAGVAAQVIVNVAGGQTATVNFGWDRHAASPTPPATPPPTLGPPTRGTPTATPGCSDHAAFMADVTIPDQAALPAEAPFVKTWRVLNTGSCTWDESYALVFADGHPMSGPPVVPFTRTVAPGGLLELSVNLVAPAAQGPHSGHWRLRGQAGETFGTGPAGDIPLRVRIVVSGTLPTPTPTPVTFAWQASYYANRHLAGQPVLVRAEPELAHDWGLGAPGPGVPADDFSARWTGTPAFEDGLYRFTLTVDDGARLWVDGELVVDDWRDAARRDLVVERPLSGARPIQLEFYDHAYDAVARLRWERVGPYPYWQGEYWANTTLDGSPALVRSDARLDFAWGSGAPAPGLPADNFSARWTRASHFDAGAYRFTVTLDDGARLWVDDQLVVDAWPGGPVRDVSGEIGLAGGQHTLRVEFVEYSGEARLAVRWQKIPALAFPDWKAEYWANTDLQGTPLLTRNEPRPDDDWGRGAPAAGVPADHFSIRWTRTLTFEAGLYRFYAIADDGVRVKVGGQTPIDEWHLNSSTAAYQADLVVSGSRVVVIEYFDNEYDAHVKVWWERLGPPP